VALFVVNIGNTRVQTGIWREGRIEDFRQQLRDDFEPDAQLPSELPVAAACVVPAARSRFTRDGIFWLHSGVATGLDLGGVSGIGADRLANAIALRDACPDRNALCLDCGTAITWEAVDANGRLRGGAIAPGRRLMRRALHEYTAQLPLLEMDNSEPPEIGADTATAIRCGVDRGCLGLVREVLAGIRMALGDRDCPCLATGGDAPFFVAHLPELKAAGLDFTLRGIALAWELNHAR